MVGTVVQPQGVAMACIQRDAGQTPRLLNTNYIAADAETSPAEILRNLGKRMPCKDIPASTVMLAGDFTLLMVEQPAVPESEMAQAVRWKIRDMIDFDLDDAVIDVFTIPGQKERGRTPMLYAVAARKDRVQQRINELSETSLQLRYVDIPELVQRNVASLLPEDAQGVALLYLDAHSGLLTLTHKSVLYLARGLEIGYQDLMPGEKSWVEEDSNGLSLEAGGMGQALLDSIALEIQRSLDYYESHFAQPPVNTLYIAPLPEALPELVSHLSRNLGVQVKMLDMNSILDCAEPISPELQHHNFQAIGAALRETA